MVKKTDKILNDLDCTMNGTKEDTMPKRKNRYFFYFGLVIIIIITAYFLMTRYEAIPQIQQEVYQETVKLNDADHQRIMGLIEDEIDSWNPDIEATVNELGSLKGSFKLSYFLAKDKLTGSEDANGFISKTVNAYILMEAIDMSTRVKDLLNQFSGELNSNSHAMLDQLSQRLPKEFDLSYKKMEQCIEGLSGNIQMVSLNTTFAEIEFMITAVLYKSISRQVKNVLKVVLKRFVKTQVLSLTAAAIDGPLPIGDTIGLGIEVVGLTWAGWELYEAQKVMKPKIRQEIQNSVEQFKQEIYASSSKTAEATLAEADKNNNAAIEGLSFIANLKLWTNEILQSAQKIITQSWINISA
jgi:hypothetical protein